MQGLVKHVLRIGAVFYGGNFDRPKDTSHVDVRT